MPLPSSSSPALALPALVGVVHLPPLPDSPRYRGDLAVIVAGAARDAETLARAGFDGVLVENFGDAPFFPGPVPAVTIAAMTACAVACRGVLPQSVALGINVLRNDAEAALAIALVADASFVRINVHTGARVTDQGVVEGFAHRTARRRRELGAERVRLVCDVDVKHAAPLARRPIADEAEELVGRGLADAVLVTGGGTGQAAAVADLHAVCDAVDVPVYVASGVTPDNAFDFARAHGFVVGSCLRASGRAGEPVSEHHARAFVDRVRALRATP